MDQKKLNPETVAELWRRGILYWKLRPLQLIVYKALRALPKSVREAVALIARRWGKSYLITLMAIEDCLQNDNVQVGISGPDLKQTKRIIIPLFKQISADAPEGLIKYTKSELTWTIGNSTLFIGAFDTALESFRGLEIFSLYLEETGLSNSEEYEYTIKSVLRPTLMHKRGRMVHATTPPVEENHPFIFQTMAEAEMNNALYRYTIYDNPFLTKEEIEDEIKAAGGRDSAHCRRELFCEIVKDTGRIVIPEFSEEAYVKPLTQPKHTFYLTAIDFGGVLDPHAVILTYYDFARNKFCVFDEVMLPINTSTDIIVEETLKLEKRNKVVWLKGAPARIADAPGQTLVDLRNMKFHCRFPLKGKDSVEDGVQALRVAFTQNKIEIDPRCKILIQTLKYGMWNKARLDFQRTDLLGHCDMLAALSYAFRHTDKVSNPIPAYEGLTRESHYIPDITGESLEDKLVNAFYGDD